MYLDEHGTDSMTRTERDQYRFLSLTGVIMPVAHARDFLVPAFNRLKANILDEDPDAPICLHRSDIRHSRGPFEPLKHENVRTKFNARLLTIMAEANYSVITAVVDKHALLGKVNWARNHPYHVLMEILVEKYALLLERRDQIGDIMPEARGNKQDNALQAEFEHFKRNGTRFARSDLVRRHIPSSNLKFRTKKDNIAGLQLCDLLAHPSHHAIREDQKHEVHLGAYAKQVVTILRNQKYHRSGYGTIKGWGTKYLP